MNPFASHLRQNQTDAEILFWRHLRDRRLDGHKFRRQQPIGKYIVDFICFERRLIVELDGSQHFDQAEYDEQRTRALQSAGFRVLRFWNNDVLDNMEGVLEKLLEHLAAPSPQPSPARGEGVRKIASTQRPPSCTHAVAESTRRSSVSPSPLAGEGWGEGADDKTLLILRRLGTRDYTPVWRAMQSFTQQRSDATPDELWLVEHPPVFTQGLNGKPEHLLAPGDIPVIQTDRGGQVTYHGPGQLVAYTLIDLQRRHLGVRDLVDGIEQTVIALLAEFGIESSARRDAPGVYVAGAKLASLGLRVRRGRSYHGVSINVAMDLEPFTRINPCGYAEIAVTDLSTLGHRPTVDDVAERFVRLFAARLGYNSVQLANASYGGGGF